MAGKESLKVHRRAVLGSLFTGAFALSPFKKAHAAENNSLVPLNPPLFEQKDITELQNTARSLIATVELELTMMREWETTLTGTRDVDPAMGERRLLLLGDISNLKRDGNYIVASLKELLKTIPPEDAGFLLRQVSSFTISTKNLTDALDTVAGRFVRFKARFKIFST